MQIQKVEIKEKIFQKASEIFLRDGFDKATMRNIAKEANVSVGNIYRYFDSKEALLEIMIEKFEKDVVFFLNKINLKTLKKKKKSKDEIFLDEFINLIKTHLKEIKILSQEISNSRFKKFEALIAQNLSDKIIAVANKVKTKTKCNKLVATALAYSAVEGIRYILLKSDDVINKKVENDLKTYIHYLLIDLERKIEEI